MPCHAMHPMQDLFFFGKFFTSTIILYVLLFAKKILFLQKVGVTHHLPLHRQEPMLRGGSGRACPKVDPTPQVDGDVDQL
jgi:hypothetical protein